MTLCVCVYSHEKVVFLLSCFYYQIEVSTLEIGVEVKFFFQNGWIHSFEESILFCFARDVFLFVVAMFEREGMERLMGIEF